MASKLLLAAFCVAAVALGPVAVAGGVANEIRKGHFEEGEVKERKLTREEVLQAREQEVWGNRLEKARGEDGRFLAEFATKKIKEEKIRELRREDAANNKQDKEDFYVAQKERTKEYLESVKAEKAAKREAEMEGKTEKAKELMKKRYVLEDQIAWKEAYNVRQTQRQDKMKAVIASHDPTTLIPDSAGKDAFRLIETNDIAGMFKRTEQKKAQGKYAYELQNEYPQASTDMAAQAKEAKYMAEAEQNYRAGFKGFEGRDYYGKLVGSYTYNPRDIGTVRDVKNVQWTQERFEATMVADARELQRYENQRMQRHIDGIEKVKAVNRESIKKTQEEIEQLKREESADAAMVTQRKGRPNNPLSHLDEADDEFESSNPLEGYHSNDSMHPKDSFRQRNQKTVVVEVEVEI